jgi:hypothetical protein
MSTPPNKRKAGGKKKYKVRNWSEYNEALVQRGNFDFIITQDALKNWRIRIKTGKPGRPQDFSDVAILSALTVREVFHLTLRQTEGLMRSMLRKLSEEAKAPDFSTLSLRAAVLPVPIRIRPLSAGKSVHIVVDSTGVKVFGEGEWKVRQHGWSKRRTWKKLHLGVDEATGEVLIGEVTENGIADCEAFPALLNQLPKDVVLDQCSADGGYDRRVCYEALRKRGVKRVAIPPQKNARIWQHGNSSAERLARDENLRAIRRVGRRQWKKDANYHRRSLAETTMFRLKTIFGDDVSNRADQNQRTQLFIRMRALNLMTALGMPRSEVVA